MILSDPRGLIYHSLVDKNLKKLLELGLNLKVYFESSLALH